jgi:hypothetical protein
MIDDVKQKSFCFVINFTLIRIMRITSSLLIIGDSGNKGSFNSSLTKRAFPLYVCEQIIKPNGRGDEELIYSRSVFDNLISAILSKKKNKQI